MSNQSERGIIEVLPKDITELWNKEPSKTSKLLGNMANAIIRFFKMMKDVIIPSTQKPPQNK